MCLLSYSVTMRYSLLPYVISLMFCFSETAYSAFLVSVFLKDLLPARKIAARQAPAVIATSEFLRRGYQTCEYTHTSSHQWM